MTERERLEREADALRVVARRLSYPKVIAEGPSDERAILEYRVELSVAEYRAAMKALATPGQEATE